MDGRKEPKKPLNQSDNQIFACRLNSVLYAALSAYVTLLGESSKTLMNSYRAVHDKSSQYSDISTEDSSSSSRYQRTVQIEAVESINKVGKPVVLPAAVIDTMDYDLVIMLGDNLKPRQSLAE